MKTKKRNICKLFCVVLACFLVGVGLGVLYSAAEEQDLYRIGIGEAGTDHFYSFSLKEPGSGGSKMIRMQNGEFVVSGILDLDRYYFDGYINWGKGDYYLYNCDTGESRQLDEELCAFLLDEYYVRCEYKEELSRMELLIFYCPAGGADEK